MKLVSISIAAASAFAFVAVHGAAVPAKAQATTFLYSVVNADGTKSRGSGAKATIHLGTGLYEVDFNRDLTFCSWNVVPGEPSSSSVGAAYATTALRSGHSAGIFVETFNGTGAFTDEPFHADVVC